MDLLTDVQNHNYREKLTANTSFTNIRKITGGETQNLPSSLTGRAALAEEQKMLMKHPSPLAPAPSFM